jgi:hypothetical protein
MKGELPLSIEGLCNEGVEPFSRREALFSLPNHQLPFLDHVHEFDPDQCVLGGPQRLEAKHGTGDPLDTAMILFHKVVEILDLADFDGGAVFVIVAPDGLFIGRTPVDSDLLWHAMAADCFGQELLGGSLIALCRQ